MTDQETRDQLRWASALAESLDIGLGEPDTVLAWLAAARLRITRDDEAIALRALHTHADELVDLYRDIHGLDGLDEPEAPEGQG